jgi:hypothetical protein
MDKSKLHAVAHDLDFEVIELKEGEPIFADWKDTPLRPTVLFVLPKGSKEDKPSYCWKMIDGYGRIYYAQITHKMLMDGMKVASKLMGN